MRARNLRPEFFTDRKMAALGVQHALIYQALWLLADDGGVCRCDPDYVKAQIFYLWPDVTASDIALALREYYRSGRVRLYAISDEVYCEIRAFSKHQKPNNPSKFRYPRAGEELTEEATVALCESYHSPTLPVPVVSASTSKNLSRRAKKTSPAVPGRNWVTDLHVWWVQHIGGVAPGLLGKHAESIHTTLGDDAIKLAAKVYFSPDEGPRYKTVPDFFTNFAQWHSLALEPMVVNGVPTARADRLARAS